MMDPLAALLTGIAGLALTALLFWPRGGLIGRWERLRRSAERIRIEDALKHFYDCEYREIACTRESISGFLEISHESTARLLDKLQSLSLIVPTGSGFALTDSGRHYALRIIRVHRLYERYLSETTGIEATEWHERAERIEHRISPEEANALARRMGDPRFDPHGDPIPTVKGELPGWRGIPLTDVDRGAAARITHLEDEPPMVYAQLVAEGLHPGMSIRIHEKTNDRMVFEADGAEIVLAPAVAGSISVELLKGEDQPLVSGTSLASLNPGESGRVIGISHACRGIQRRRMMDLGVVPGTIISSDMKSATGDPTAYSIRGATIALRKQQAELIHVVPIQKGKSFGE